jgi:hypothetical protein
MIFATAAEAEATADHLAFDFPSGQRLREDRDSTTIWGHQPVECVVTDEGRQRWAANIARLCQMRTRPPVLPAHEAE